MTTFKNKNILRESTFNSLTTALDNHKGLPNNATSNMLHKAEVWKRGFSSAYYLDVVSFQ